MGAVVSLPALDLEGKEGDDGASLSALSLVSKCGRGEEEPSPTDLELPGGVAKGNFLTEDPGLEEEECGVLTLPVLILESGDELLVSLLWNCGEMGDVGGEATFREPVKLFLFLFFVRYIQRMQKKEERRTRTRRRLYLCSPSSPNLAIAHQLTY